MENRGAFRHKDRMTTLNNHSVSDLLALHTDVMQELRDRGIIRSGNNPTGDLAEYLFCKAFGWSQVGKSVKSYDAIDGNKQRYQIKSRRLQTASTSRQLAAFRSFSGFDVLAAVLFDERYRVQRGLLLPAETVKQSAKPDPHTNSHKFMLTDNLWNLADAEDVTDQLREALAAL